MKIKHIAKIIGKITLWILGIWLGLLLIIQIVLSSPVLTKIINGVAEDYIDADVKFGEASVSIFSHFPKITLNLEDVEITYPHDRFDTLAQKCMQGHLLYSGCGEVADTLASLRRLSASVSLLSLLKGDIKLPDIEIESPKIYAHYYDENNANWNIFGTEEYSETETQAEPSDTTYVNPSEKSDAEESMNIIMKRISFKGNPKIVYTDSQDSLYALITMKSMSFDGNFETEALHKTLADAAVDSLFIAGRYGKDTLAIGLDQLRLKEKDNCMNMKVLAKTFMATEAFGRMMIPIEFNSGISIQEDPGISVSLRNITANIATIPFKGNLDVIMRDDRIITEGDIKIPGCQIQTVLHRYMAQFIPELTEVKTDTEVSADLIIRGHYGYDDGQMPDVKATISIPDSEIDYSTFPAKIRLGMDAKFHMDSIGIMNTDVTRAWMHTYGMGLNAKCAINDMTGNDPEIKVQGHLRAALDSLRHFLPDTMNIVTNGSLTADLDGTLRMSHLDMYEFSKAGIEGTIEGQNIVLKMPEDTIDVKLDGLSIRLAPEHIKSKRDPSRTFRLMGLTGRLAAADVNYKEEMIFKGKNIEIGAQNSAKEQEANNISYVGGRFNAELIQLDDSEGTSIKLEKTQNSFHMRPKRGQPTIPVLALKNKNLRITYKTADNRVILTDSEITAEAAMNTIDRKRRRESFLDSLSSIYPDIPRDSLFKHMRSTRAARDIPSWMADNEFKNSDIKVDLNETFKKYYREWDITGHAGIRTGILMTPYLPLRNILRGASLSLDNNHIAIDSLKMMTGESEIHAKGSISGLRRVMLGNGNIIMDLDLGSTSLNADELWAAYVAGSQYEANETKPAEELTNAEFFKQVTIDTVKIDESTSSSTLAVIPGNVNANITIKASGINYKNLNISSFDANMVIKERCAQLTGTSMRSNMGGFDLDAFYVTRSKEDIRAGFCLDVKDVTSEKVISLVPEIGEVIPMVSSINGLLNCEIAATASLDTTMSIIMPSVNGILRMSGKDLSITDDELYTSVAKMLLFRNKRKGEIDMLEIEGTIKDNTIEVFPFILKVDRYTLGLSGIQNMDMSYKHHVSVLRSPLLIRLGLNISGPDYDHMKFKLGKALYRVKKIPSFSAVIDQTKNDLRYSIYNIFETGIDNTIENRDMQALISQHQNKIGYINAAKMDMEELSEEELNDLEKSEASDTAMEEAMAAAVAAVQEVLENN